MPKSIRQIAKELAGTFHGVEGAAEEHVSPALPSPIYGGVSGSAAVELLTASAQLRADKKASRPKTAKLAGNPRLRTEVEARLKLNHSPEQISGRLMIEVC